MFKNLSDSFSKIMSRIRSNGLLTVSHIDAAIIDIKNALIEADVAITVANNFTESVKQKAIGQEIIKSVTPAQMVIKILHDELVSILSSTPELQQLNLKSARPVGILTVGLQGSGKTTFSGKLAKLLNKDNKVLLVSLDTYRPAAQEQLAILAKSANIDSLTIIPNELPLEITKRAMMVAKTSGYDMVIYDTAGRLHVDTDMMHELQDIKALVNPSEILLVVDALTGQDAVNIAKQFNDILNISGVVLSKTDGDARGGAALSMKYITGKPIKFLSNGEKLSDLEPFEAERLAGRILDMGDVVSLVEKAKEAIDDEKSAKLANRIQRGLFDMNDYLMQLRSIKKMGGFANIISMLPGTNNFSGKVDLEKKEAEIRRSEAIILSMTKIERKRPDVINASRKKRIASGSGTTIQDVNKILKQFIQMSSMIKKVSRMDPKNLMRSGIGKLFS